MMFKKVEDVRFVLTGTASEKRKYKIYKFLWEQRWCFYWLFLFCQIIPIASIAAIEPSISTYALVATGVVFVIHTVLWFLCWRYNSGEHPVMIPLKKRILVKGLFISVLVPHYDNGIDTGVTKVDFGFYQSYDVEKKMHRILIDEKPVYVKTAQLLP